MPRTAARKEGLLQAGSESGGGRSGRQCSALPAPGWDINAGAAVAAPQEQEKVMRTLGYVTAIAMAAAGTAVGLVAVRSLPEVRRYIAMRKM